MANRPNDDHPNKEDDERIPKVCAPTHSTEYNSDTSISLGIGLQNHKR